MILLSSYMCGARMEYGECVCECVRCTLSLSIDGRALHTHALREHLNAKYDAACVCYLFGERTRAYPCSVVNTHQSVIFLNTTRKPNAGRSKILCSGCVRTRTNFWIMGSSETRRKHRLARSGREMLSVCRWGCVEQHIYCTIDNANKSNCNLNRWIRSITCSNKPIDKPFRADALIIQTVEKKLAALRHTNASLSMCVCVCVNNIRPRTVNWKWMYALFAAFGNQTNSINTVLLSGTCWCVRAFVCVVRSRGDTNTRFYALLTFFRGVFGIKSSLIV